MHIQNFTIHAIKKYEKEQRKKTLDVSVGGLYNNRGSDLPSLLIDWDSQIAKEGWSGPHKNVFSEN